MCIRDRLEADQLESVASTYSRLYTAYFESACEEIADYDKYDYCLLYTSLLLKKWNYQREHNLAGGVCDMTLVYLWSKDNDRVLNSARIFDGGTIDQNLCDRVNFSENEYRYNSFAGIKKYVIRKDALDRKQPYLEMCIRDRCLCYGIL